MNEYEARLQAKRDRLEKAADRAAAESEARFRNASASIADIPSGQPILIGHHSEGRHRADLRRYDSNMRAGIEAEKRAEEYASRAASVGTGGVNSDDPEALVKLREKLAEQEATQAQYKAVNAAHRKFFENPDSVSDDEKELIREFVPPYSNKPGSVQPCTLSNLATRIRNTKKRIEQMERLNVKRETLPENETTDFAGGSVTIDRESNRVLVRIDRRLTKPEHQIMRGNGYVWAPSVNAYSRKWNGYDWLAKRIREVVEGFDA